MTSKCWVSCCPIGCSKNSNKRSNAIEIPYYFCTHTEEFDFLNCFWWSRNMVCERLPTSTWYIFGIGLPKYKFIYLEYILLTLSLYIYISICLYLYLYIIYLYILYIIILYILYIPSYFYVFYNFFPALGPHKAPKNLSAMEKVTELSSNRL